MPAPYNTPGSKLDRAIAAYLISMGGLYTAKNTFPANSRASANYPYVLINSRRWTPSPVNVACREFDVNITFFFSAVQAVNDNSNAARVALDLFVGTAIDALFLSDNNQDLAATCALINAAGRALATSADPQVAEDNADMVDFTLKRWNGDDGERGDPDIEGCAWSELFRFKADMACANVD